MRGEKIRDNARHQRIDIVEAGNLKIKDFYAGFFHGTSRAYLNDDPYPGTLDVTEFSAVSWNGENPGVHLYSIAEKNGNVCFTSGIDIPVGDCIANSSSSTESSSSSSEGTAIALTRTVKNSVELYGTTLAVNSNVSGEKLVRLYDFSGREIFHRRFDGDMATFDVKNYSGKMLFVRLSGGGRVLLSRRIVVR